MYILCTSSKDGPTLVSYDFDVSLSKLPIVPVGPVGQIAVNNLTSTPLREKWVENLFVFDLKYYVSNRISQPSLSNSILYNKSTA